MQTFYLDHAATSPVHPEVIECMSDAMARVYGNPSSIHTAGRFARKVLDEARKVLADSIGAKDTEIILTSGGTEADNTAIFGVARALKSKGKHIITTSVEHHAVLHTCEQLEKEGYEVTYLPVDETGRIAVESVKNALRDDTILVSIMYGNNEVGTIQPIKEIGELLKDHPAVFHTDAVQAYGLEKIDVNELHVDLLSVSSHKINGPKGIGFLYQREKTPLFATFYGGSQERKRRAGTENVHAAVGFAKAVEIAQREMEKRRQTYLRFREAFLDVLNREQIAYKVNGHKDHFLKHILNISFPGMDVESFLVNLDMDGVYASSGSACTAGSIDPSHVLVAMYGKGAPELRNSIRFSFGLGLEEEDIRQAAERTAKIVKRMTNL
ncbi:cysteine desulfurase family protein [Ureibacillus sp. FSL K6-8385]|uniref:cysteine desulfurase n=1 Tax=Ureibacillus terrenus TaxID=118246 RepID=A0A540V546_9BACL|nr:cysteine desulfurase family protein [Ureibacillus terrenus]MED3662642.1 cysteine desulfurase family protein [Ureibacillus terrenus]TQE91862.1 cysteine desulfurase [Ureibacillus terrenus]